MKVRRLALAIWRLRRIELVDNHIHLPADLLPAGCGEVQEIQRGVVRDLEQPAPRLPINRRRPNGLDQRIRSTSSPSITEPTMRAIERLAASRPIARDVDGGGFP
jgi:hypothetical protein